MIQSFIKRLFCNHSYLAVGGIFTNNTIASKLLQCTKCNKKKQLQHFIERI